MWRTEVPTHACLRVLPKHTSRCGRTHNQPPLRKEAHAFSLRTSLPASSALAFCFKLLPNNTQKVNIVTYLKAVRMTRKIQKHLPLTLYSHSKSLHSCPSISRALVTSHQHHPFFLHWEESQNMDPLTDLHRLHVGSHVFLHNLHSHFSLHTPCCMRPPTLECSKFSFVLLGPYHMPLTFAETVLAFPGLLSHACCSGFSLAVGFSLTL